MKNNKKLAVVLALCVGIALFVGYIAYDTSRPINPQVGVTEVSPEENEPVGDGTPRRLNAKGVDISWIDESPIRVFNDGTYNLDYIDWWNSKFHVKELYDVVVAEAMSDVEAVAGGKVTEEWLEENRRIVFEITHGLVPELMPYVTLKQAEEVAVEVKKMNLSMEEAHAELKLRLDALAVGHNKVANSSTGLPMYTYNLNWIRPPVVQIVDGKLMVIATFDSAGTDNKLEDILDYETGEIRKEYMDLSVMMHGMNPDVTGYTDYEMEARGWEFGKRYFTEQDMSRFIEESSDH